MCNCIDMAKTALPLIHHTGACAVVSDLHTLMLNYSSSQFNWLLIVVTLIFSVSSLDHGSIISAISNSIHILTSPHLGKIRKFKWMFGAP